jgi:hypothetical protein
MPAGRLNVLANVVRKPMSQIFSEFSGAPTQVWTDGTLANTSLAAGSVGQVFTGTQMVWLIVSKATCREAVSDSWSCPTCCCSQAKDGEYTGSGDVKYHLGTSFNRPTSSGKQVHLSLVANPRYEGHWQGRQVAQGGGTTVAFFATFNSTSTPHPGRAPTSVQMSWHT